MSKARVGTTLYKLLIARCEDTLKAFIIADMSSDIAEHICRKMCHFVDIRSAGGKYYIRYRHTADSGESQTTTFDTPALAWQGLVEVVTDKIDDDKVAKAELERVTFAKFPVKTGIYLWRGDPKHNWTPVLLKYLPTFPVTNDYNDLLVIGSGARVRVTASPNFEFTTWEGLCQTQGL